MQYFTQIEHFLAQKDKRSANLIVKQLHDDTLKCFPPLSEESLIIENLNNQQVWSQLARHMQVMVPTWQKFLNKVEREVDRRSREQDKEKMIDEDEYIQQQGEEEQEQFEPKEAEDDRIEEEVNEDEQQAEGKHPMNNGMLDIEDEDIGLYGQQLDEEDSYNDEQGQQQQDGLGEGDEFDGEMPAQEASEADQGDDLEGEHFDHFREVQMENQQGDEGEEQEQKPQEELDEISKLENRLLDKSDWRLKGEVQSRDRPLNSLVENNLQFKRTIKPNQQPTEQYNSQIETLIKQRVLDKLFDDRVRFEMLPGFRDHFTSLPEVSIEKNSQSLGELYEKDFKNSLGLKESKEQKLKNDIMAQFKQLNYNLDCLTNFSFVPKPVIKQAKVTSQQFIIREEKIPITVAQAGQDAPENLRRQLKSEKELSSRDRSAVRLKNKRIGRQRKKEHDAKKMNRSIEYGGLTKFEAQARKKILKSKLSAKKVKYSQSGQFFKSLQENTQDKKKGKPNPNINKLKM